MPYLSLLESLTETTAPTTEPVTIESAREFVGLPPDDTTLDSQLLQAIKGARRVMTERLSRTLVTTTWTAQFRDFPRWTAQFRDFPSWTSRDSDLWFELPYPPLSSVTSVKYYDENGTQQTWATTNYIVDTASEPGRIALDPGGEFIWPTTEADRIQRVEVVFVAGYGTIENVPEHAKLAVLNMAYELFDQRGSVAMGSVSRLPVVDALSDSLDWGQYS